MAITLAPSMATVEAREVLRCDSCKLVQFRTVNSLCRRCHKPLESDEPKPNLVTLALVSEKLSPEDNTPQVARMVRELRRRRNLSQRQLAARMEVPRTYISKVENGRAMPTLSSLERLAEALEVQIQELLLDARSCREAEATQLMSDPFLAELTPLAMKLTPLHRSMFLNQMREMSTGRRKSA